MQAEDYVNRINVEEGMRFGKNRAKMHEVYLLFAVNKFLILLAALNPVIW